MITLSPSGGDDTSAVTIACRTPGVGIVHLGPGDWNISALNLTGLTNLILEGEGLATRIMPTVAANAVIDISGSRFLQLRDFRLGQFDQTIVPSVGILSLQDAGYSSNWIRLENLMVDGKYSISAFYCYGIASSKADGCAFWNYENNSYTVELCNDNVRGMTSQFLSNILSPSATPQPPMSDWQFNGCEFHSQRTGGVSNGFGLRLSGCTQIKFDGGNCSGSANEIVTIRKGANVSCKDIAFRGTTFYAEPGTNLPNYGISVLDPMSNLLVHGNYTTATSGLVQGIPYVSNFSFIA